MNFSFHPEAETELNEAIQYYEECEAGLGFDFSIEVFASIQHIVCYPHAWPIMVEHVRRCLVNRFPFGLIYSIEEREIFILAVMHLRRHPDYWKDRH